MPCFTYKRVIIPLFAVIMLLSAVFPATADFNTTIDSILSEENLSYGSAAFILLAGTGVISEDASIQEAAGIMSQQFPDTASAWNDTVTLGSFSYMIMSAYGIEGGLMYRIFPGPRYAIRELRFKRIIQERAYSGMQVSGERAFRIVGRVLDREEAGSEE